jgi:hypothetical protein
MDLRHHRRDLPLWSAIFRSILGVDVLMSIKLEPHSVRFDDCLNHLIKKAGTAAFSIDQTLTSLSQLHDEAAIESGFRSAENSSPLDPKAVKIALEMLADQVTSETRRNLDRLVETRLDLSEMIRQLKTLSTKVDQK